MNRPAGAGWALAAAVLAGILAAVYLARLSIAPPAEVASSRPPADDSGELQDDARNATDDGSTSEPAAATSTPNAEPAGVVNDAE